MILIIKGQGSGNYSIFGWGCHKELFPHALLKSDVIYSISEVKFNLLELDIFLLFASILVRFSLQLQRGKRMFITQALTIHDYVNVTLDVWKTIYSS